MTTPQRIVRLWKRGESVRQIRGITGASADYVLDILHVYIESLEEEKRNGAAQ